MKIWWCQEHGSVKAGDWLPGNPYCWKWSELHSESTDPVNFMLTCRFVPMRLIPDNAGEAIARVIDAITFLEEGIEHGGDIADESEAVYDAARELRGRLALDGETP